MKRRLPRRSVALLIATAVLLFTAGPATAAPADDPDVVMDFENGYFASGWLPNLRADGSSFNGGAAFDPGASSDAWAPTDITGFRGHSWADSYYPEAADEGEDTYKGDRAMGNLTSPELTVTHRYLNALIAGGRHPHEPGRSIYLPLGDIFADFSGGRPSGWTGTGGFADIRTPTNWLPGQVGARLDTCVGGCDTETGTVTSPSFTIDHDWISLPVAGGHHPWGSPGATAVRLVVDRQTVRSATGQNRNLMDWVSWDVSAYRGHSARIELVDDNAGHDWGHIAIGTVTFGDARQAPWSNETAINILHDGQVVGSVTGNDSPALRPASIDLAGYVGQQVRIQIVDQATTGPWAHLIVDQLEFSATATG